MSIENMKLSLHDAIINAVMIKKPLVVVEGKDDLPIYTKLAKTISGNTNVKPIQYFKDCSSGCSEIERKVEEVNNIYSHEHKAYDYFLGVVDRDAKEFRGEIKNYDGIFYLDTYSFENSFVSKNTLLSIVENITTLTSNELTEDLSGILLEKINSSLTEFYYVTLEALKNAVERDYEGLIGFSDGYEKALKNPNIRSQLMQKREELDVFASNNNLSCCCILNFGHFCKGKWHLQYFLTRIKEYAKTLSSFCGENIEQCPYCKVQDYSNCLYKVKSNIDISHLIAFMKSDLNNANFGSIENKLIQLAI